MRQTGEVFNTYEEYLQRLHLLHSKQWTSKISGRNGLNYEEAIHEDSNVDSLLAKACLPHAILRYKVLGIQQSFTFEAPTPGSFTFPV